TLCFIYSINEISVYDRETSQFTSGSIIFIKTELTLSYSYLVCRICCLSLFQCFSNRNIFIHNCLQTLINRIFFLFFRKFIRKDSYPMFRNIICSNYKFSTNNICLTLLCVNGCQFNCLFLQYTFNKYFVYSFSNSCFAHFNFFLSFL